MTKHPRALRLVPLAACAAMVALPAAASARGEVREWKKSVVTVISELALGVGSGTGWVVDPAGFVVTNHHVIDGAKSVHVYFDATVSTSATVVADDAKLDLALLKLGTLDASKHPPMTLFSGARVEDGDEVYALGFPGTDAMAKAKTVESLVASRGEASARDGKVTKVTKDPDGREVIQTSAEITHGNSGGPLVDACGTVIGVNTFLACADKSRPWDCARFAVAHGEVLRFLEKTGVKPSTTSSICDASQSTSPLLIAAIVAAGLLGLAGLVVGLRRGSREAIVQYVSRSIRRKPPTHDRQQQVQFQVQQQVQQRAVPSAWMLVGLAGPLAGAEIPLGPEPVFVGRDPKVANVVLPPETHGVSRRHVEVALRDGVVQVRDSWSSQGTSVDGRKIESGEWVTVSPGQRIELGGPAVSFGVRC